MIQPTNEQMTRNLYPQAGANAVSINIYNPQAYGSTPQQNAQAPYNYTNSLYQLPTSKVYSAPQSQAPQAPIVPPQYFMPQAPVVMNQSSQPIIAPQPNMMPDSVIPQQPANVQKENKTEATDKANSEVNNNIPTVDVDSLISNLKSNNPSFKGEAINKIAEYAQDKPEIALQVVSEPVMQALVDVIKEDTTGLEGPTDKQVEIAEKISKGEKLTPEEETLSEQLSPRDLANKNRIFALYTLAMIQKLQRDELNQYIETQKANGEEAIAPLALEDLIGYSDMVNIINNDQRPEVKVAAIQALEHVAQIEDKAKVQDILKDSLNSSDEPVKAAAQEALNKFEA